MTKADTIRLLYSERCSISEIAAAVGWRESAVQNFLRHGLIRSRLQRVFVGWRGMPISHVVMSL
ncbi:hypothetical protein [[Pseudomonas] boreopolis]|uniref:Uncharacterized protein n=1 Tax=Xanthomonas boreopolis TaxID=86183 RepID=A0A919KI19_9XANT|nr:hypothetical protein GCM10009090_17930 [[Pseudomonas] boreopolis]